MRFRTFSKEKHQKLGLRQSTKPLIVALLNKQINRLLVGIFCLGALAILLGFAFFTGSFSFLRENNERFVLVFNENVYGLHEGSKVTFNGVRIGRVERFFLGDQLKARTRLQYPLIQQVDPLSFPQIVQKSQAFPKLHPHDQGYLRLIE